MPPFPPNSYTVAPGFVVGPHPRRSGAPFDGAVAALWGDMQPTLVIDLTTPAEGHASYSSELLQTTPAARRVAFPIADMGVPSLPQLGAVLACITTARAAGESIYLHCAAGIGRSGLVVCAWLMYNGAAMADALAQIHTLRAHTEHPAAVPESALQAMFLAAWEHNGCPLPRS